MLDWLGLGKVVGDISKELIDTPQEKAMALAHKIKTLDPNGVMRRELARFASIMFCFYLVNCVVLGYMVSFDIGNADGAKFALNFMGDLFLPIISSWSAIVGASFGVNISNNIKDMKSMVTKDK